MKRNRKKHLALALAIFAIGGFSCPLLETSCGAAEPAKQTVPLVIDYGDGVQKHFTGLEWKEGMTVQSLMEAASRHRRGIRFEHRGSGATGFLYQIDDVKNEGRGKNWVYRINGKLADRGFALSKLNPADRVGWSFEVYSKN